MDFIVDDITRVLTTIKTCAPNDNPIYEAPDNSHGIEPDNLQHTFDSIFAVEAFGKGTGLGLSIQYGIIPARNEGRLPVDNSVGEGTKFELELPIKQDTSDDQG